MAQRPLQKSEKQDQKERVSSVLEFWTLKNTRLLIRSSDITSVEETIDDDGAIHPSVVQIRYVIGDRYAHAYVTGSYSRVVEQWNMARGGLLIRGG